MTLEIGKTAAICTIIGMGIRCGALGRLPAPVRPAFNRNGKPILLFIGASNAPNFLIMEDIYVT